MQFGAVIEGQDVVVAIAPRGDRVRAEHQLDAVAAQHLAECVAQRRGLASEHVLDTLGKGHLAAQAPHRLCHLGADRAAAEDEQAAGDGLHPGHLAVGPHSRQLAQARDRRDDRDRAGRDNNVPGGVPHAVDLDHAGPGQGAGATQQVDALAGQPPHLPVVGVIADHEVPPGQRRFHVDLRGGRRLVRVMYCLAGAQQRLGRDARPVRAVTPGQFPLDHGHPQAAVRQFTGAVLPGGAGAHNDHVIVGVHGFGLPPMPESQPVPLMLVILMPSGHCRPARRGYLISCR